MSDIPEAMGDLAQATLVAHAAEPVAGERAKDDSGHTHEPSCLNCGAKLVGSHCHACGQPAHVHRSLSAFFHDLLHGVFHFEGKLWRTLPMLAWRPGRLTREYIDGRRASYVSPIAVFLFVVFLMFAVVSWLEDPVNVGSGQLRSGLTADVAQSEAQIKVLEAERRQLVARSGNTLGIDAKLADARKAAALEKAIAKDGIRGAAARASDDVPRWLAKPLGNAAENPDLLLYKLQSASYKYSWLLIPLSVPLVFLLFPFNRRFHLYDHTVFVTYSLSFMMVLLILATAGARFGAQPIMIGAVSYAPFHMYRQLRGTYGTSRAGSAWRTAALLIFASIALMLFAAAILVLALG